MLGSKGSAVVLDWHGWSLCIAFYYVQHYPLVRKPRGHYVWLLPIGRSTQNARQRYLNSLFDRKRKLRDNISVDRAMLKQGSV